MDILGKDVLTSPPELDRAHRALRPKPTEGDKPGAVIICFHKFQTKDMVIRAARKKRDDLKYDGKSVYLYNDYCPEVMDQRAEYKEVMRQLFTLKLKPSLLYPARLFIKADDGERRCLFSVKEAQQFCYLGATCFFSFYLPIPVFLFFFFFVKHTTHIYYTV